MRTPFVKEQSWFVYKVWGWEGALFVCSKMMNPHSGQGSVPTAVRMEIQKAFPLLVLHTQMQEVMIYLDQMRTRE